LKSAPVHFFLAKDFFVELSVTWMTLRAPAYLLALSAHAAAFLIKDATNRA